MVLGSQSRPARHVSRMLQSCPDFRSLALVRSIGQLGSLASSVAAQKAELDAAIAEEEAIARGPGAEWCQRCVRSLARNWCLVYLRRGRRLMPVLPVSVVEQGCSRPARLPPRKCISPHYI